MGRMALVVAGLGVAAALTGCGGNDFADRSADDIVTTAKADMKDLTSLKVSGEITSGGQHVSLDIQTDSDGDCTGTIGIEQGSAELLGVGGETWMKPDETFWRSLAGDSADQVMAAVGDKWVVVPDSADSLTNFCDSDQLLDGVLKDEDDGSTYSKSGTAEVDGDQVVKVDNDDPKDGTSTGYVRVDEPHYLLKIEKTGGDEQGSVTFSAFDEDVDVLAPADGDVYDLGTLSG